MGIAGSRRTLGKPIASTQGGQDTGGSRVSMFEQFVDFKARKADDETAAWTQRFTKARSQ